MIVKPISLKWHPGLSIYASERFLKAVSREFGWIAGYDEAGRCQCLLPYTVTRKVSVRMVRFRTETIWLDGEQSVDHEKGFLNAVVHFFRAVRADMIIPGTTNAVFRTIPDGAIAAPYGTYVLDLSRTEDDLWMGLHCKHRNAIRAAAKKGVQIHRGPEYTQTAFNLVKDTLKRSGLSFMDEASFKKYVNALGENLEIFVAESDGRPQGCAVIPFSAYAAYYVYGGSVQNPVTGSMNLLHWEAIKHFKESGVCRYDFVGARVRPEKGSKQHGLKVFKERFGGRFVEGFIWKQPFRRFKYLLYAAAIRVLRGGDIVDQERHKLVGAPVSSGIERDNEEDSFR